MGCAGGIEYLLKISLRKLELKLNGDDYIWNQHITNWGKFGQKPKWIKIILINKFIQRNQIKYLTLLWTKYYKIITII